MFSQVKDHGFAFAAQPVDESMWYLSVGSDYSVNNGTYEAALLPWPPWAGNGLACLSSESDVNSFMGTVEQRAEIMAGAINEIVIPDDTLRHLDLYRAALFHARGALADVGKVTDDESVIAPLKGVVGGINRQIRGVYGALGRQFADVLDGIADRVG